LFLFLTNRRAVKTYLGVEV